MTEYTLIFSGQGSIDFSPPNEAAEILQNVKTLISTMKYTVPLFRDFGMDGSIIDEPVNSSYAHICSEIIQAVRKYEPRAEISHINFSPGEQGGLSFTLRIRIPGTA